MALLLVHRAHHGLICRNPETHVDIPRHRRGWGRFIMFSHNSVHLSYIFQTHWDNRSLKMAAVHWMLGSLFTSLIKVHPVFSWVCPVQWNDSISHLLKEFLSRWEHSVLRQDVTWCYLHKVKVCRSGWAGGRSESMFLTEFTQYWSFHHSHSDFPLNVTAIFS